MFDYKLALMTGVDIPIPELQLVIHQPTIKEISYIGEKDFFTGLQVLTVNKNAYIDDEILLADTTNFQIFMTMVSEKEMADKKLAVMQVLQLLFPGANIAFTPRSMIISMDGQNVMVDENNFETIQTIVKDIFCIKNNEQKEFNPASDKAKKIAEKIMRSRQKIAEMKQNSGSVFSQYLSVIAVGIPSMSLLDVIQLTMYQMYDLVERFTLYMNWDLDVRSRLAGAKGDKPLDDWMKQIH